MTLLLFLKLLYDISMLSLFPELFTFEQLAPLILRLVLGAIFIRQGYPKLASRPVKLWVLAAGVVEFFGGVFLLAGFLTQLAAGLIALDRIAAIWKVKFSKLNLALLAISLALLVLGPGNFSIDLPL